MRSDDEDDEDDFDEENEEDEDTLENRANGIADGEDDQMEFYDEDGSGEENDEEDADGEGDEEGDDDDEDEEEDAEAEDEDEDEDEDEEDHSDEEADGDDVDMANGDEASSHTSRETGQERTDYIEPQPPHLVRRGLFKPAFTSPPSTISIEAIVAIPLPASVHSIAATACSSYLLAGGADGYIRAYDFWSSVNGSQMLTAQQKTMVGLGEGVNKAGVPRGWWTNEVEGIKDGNVTKRIEGVYSMAIESDGLWALTGTQSGPINLYTIRHSPGHLVHSLKGHSNVVSCMTLLPGEKGFISGSWDGSVREWDLNTGQVVRQYPTHGAQISSLALRPYHPPSPTPSPTNAADDVDEENKKENGLDGVNISVTVGADFNQSKDEKNGDEKGAEANNGTADVNGSKATETADEPMSTAPSPFDPLFDDDADGETVLPSGDITMAGTPAINDMAPPSPPKSPKRGGLSLPGSAGMKDIKPEPNSSAIPSTAASGSTTPLFNLPQPVASTSKTAASNIPVLSPSSYKSFSDDIFLTSSMDGQVVLIDRRVPDYTDSKGVGRLIPNEKSPPWCMSACWLGDGKQVLAGRRNGTMDIWDVRRYSTSSNSPSLLRTLRTPQESGPMSCLVALQDGRHVATASQDNVRLWNTAEYFGSEENVKRKGSRPPFKIIAGHHGGTVSAMHVDPTCRFLITASGDRGWQGEATKMVLIHEIKW